MADLMTKKPLEIVADAFKELATMVNSPSPVMPVKQFSEACSLFMHLFNVLEEAFKFAEIDYVVKVNDLAKASNSISTLEVMVDKDIEANCVKHVGSHTRNLLRIKRGLEMIKCLGEELIATEADSSLKDAVFKAYNQVFSPYHTYGIQKAAATGIESLPPRAFLWPMISETGFEKDCGDLSVSECQAISWCMAQLLSHSCCCRFLVGTAELLLQSCCFRVFKTVTELDNTSNYKGFFGLLKFCISTGIESLLGHEVMYWFYKCLAKIQ
ncbi:unnamed protein product [Arabis nemorensis]|uniref:Glycolipid transfer protein domain-containing protein n=1 Tax=Arabis nemorensis TaxID=586526 RepID=A0A565C3G3_9BRAS|nr:unnamed protein product [Arabis nemorensis]